MVCFCELCVMVCCRKVLKREGREGGKEEKVERG